MDFVCFKPCLTESMFLLISSVDLFLFFFFEWGPSFICFMPSVLLLSKLGDGGNSQGFPMYHSLEERVV